MVFATKTIVSRSQYEAPACKLYSISVESVIAQSDYGNPGGAGGDLGGGEEHDL